MERKGEEKRTVVPRWRALASTPQLELQSSSARPVKEPRKSLAHIMDGALEEWRRMPNAVNAAEVADAVSLLGPDVRSFPALEFLKSQRSTLAPLITKRLSADEGSAAITTRLQLQTAIARKKKTLRDQPRNAIAQVEISRLYVVAGQVHKAVKHMELALAIAGNDRFILRSATRLFVHIGEPDRAIDFIEISDAVRTDPWIMAAEVAASDLVGLTPRWGVKEIKAINDTKRLSIQYSELASALGALEDENGSHKRAKELIKRSLHQPTENSLAQAAWMTTHAKRQYISLDAHRQESAHEFGLIQAVHVKDYKRADRFAWQWLNDEPFSAKAAAHGSYVNSVFTRQYERALAFSERGVFSNPGDEVLLNNKIFALIMLGRLQDAKGILPAVPGQNSDTHRDVYDLALHGLFQFKSGKLKDGRDLYREAVQRAANSHQSVYAAAISQWMENEVLHGTVTKPEFEKLATTIDQRLKKMKLETSVWDATKAYLGVSPVTATEIRSIKNSRTGELIKFIIQ
jgi:tetratricopeptide (TPR) repeat protein